MLFSVDLNVLPRVRLEQSQAALRAEVVLPAGECSRGRPFYVHKLLADRIAGRRHGGPEAPILEPGCAVRYRADALLVARAHRGLVAPGGNKAQKPHDLLAAL